MNDFEDQLRRDLALLPQPAPPASESMLRTLHRRNSQRRAVAASGLLSVGAVATAAVSAGWVSPPGLQRRAPVSAAPSASSTPTTLASASSQDLRSVALPAWWAESSAAIHRNQKGPGGVTFNGDPQAYSINGVVFVVLDATYHFPTVERHIRTWVNKTSSEQNSYDTGTPGIASSDYHDIDYYPNFPDTTSDLWVLPDLPKEAAAVRYELPGHPAVSVNVQHVQDLDGHLQPTVGAVLGLQPANYASAQATITVVSADGTVLKTVDADTTRLLRFGTPVPACQDRRC